MSTPVKRSVVVSGHRTSVSLENPFWDVLTQIATDQNVSLNKLITEVDRQRDGNLSSALRVYVLKKLQEYRT
jgi:predicted DNA-binding ribbon-helix-helix protein